MSSSHASTQAISSTISNVIFASLGSLNTMAALAEALILLTGIPLMVFTITSIFSPASNISDMVCSRTCNNDSRSSELSGKVTFAILSTQGTVTFTAAWGSSAANGEEDGTNVGSLEE